MKPLHHPALEAVTVEGILYALSDVERIRILFEIMRANGPMTCSAFVRGPSRNLPKSTVSQHFRVLRESGWIRSERKGVEMHNTPNTRNSSPNSAP